MNYEFNLLHDIGVVAKRVDAAAAETAAHEGDDNTPLGPTGRGANKHLTTGLVNLLTLTIFIIFIKFVK